MRAKGFDELAVTEKAEIYFAAHPGSPSAVRRPTLSIRGGRWIALLGRSVEDGIFGFGSSVEAALRSFDEQYLAALRPPANNRRDVGCNRPALSGRFPPDSRARRQTAVGFTKFTTL